MLSAALVIFREFFEISIILSIILIATDQLKHRYRYIMAGLAMGIAGAAIFAFFATTITNMADGFGQEIVNIVILTLAILMISWTIMWMGQSSYNLSKSFKLLGKQVQQGEKPKIILSFLIASTIFREGTEIILFLSGILVSGINDLDFLLGAGFGVVLGIAFGLLFYAGLLKYATKHVFSFTSWLLILLAAGLAAQIAGNLVQAGIITGSTEPLWDSSWLIPNSSYLGEFLHNILGYTSRPTGIEVLFYCGVLILLVIIVNITKRQDITKAAK